MSTATPTGTEPFGTQTGAKAAATEAVNSLSEVASSAAEDAKSLAGDAKGEALAVAGEAKDKAKDLAVETRQQLRRQAAEQAGRAAGAIRELSGQLSTMAGAVDGGLAPDLAQQASSSIDQLAARLEDGGLDSVVADLKRFARNNPGTFLLGAAAAGMLAGRLARSVDTHALADAVKPHDDAAPSDDSTASPPPALGTTAAYAPEPVVDRPPSGATGGVERPLPAPGR